MWIGLMEKSALYQSRKRKMISRKRLNLFPIIFQFKQYGLKWYRLGHCCNRDHYSWKPLLLIKFAFKDYVYWRCPQCGKRHKIKLSYHVEGRDQARVRS